MTYWNDTNRTNPQSSELFAGYIATNITGYPSHVEGYDTFLPDSTQFLDNEMARVGNALRSK